MARARNIKPGFFTNDVLAEVPALGRILFQGLWCHADREGRLEDRPRKIKAEILPYDECNVDELLDALAVRGFVLRYQVGEARYIQVVNFTKHQNPHVKEPASVIPAPTQHQTSTVQAPEIPEPARLIPDSLNLIPDSPISDGASAPKHEYPEEFERTWREFPQRAGDNPKKDAFRAWSARLKEGSEAQEMYNGTRRYREFCEGTGKLGTEFVMQAKRFFGQNKAFSQLWAIPPGDKHETNQRIDNSAPARVRRANAAALESEGRIFDHDPTAPGSGR